MNATVDGPKRALGHDRARERWRRKWRRMLAILFAGVLASAACSSADEDAATSFDEAPAEERGDDGSATGSLAPT